MTGAPAILHDARAQCGSAPDSRMAVGFRAADLEPPRSHKGPAPRPTAERFWSYVDRRGPEECWPWRGNVKNGLGYGRFTTRGGREGKPRQDYTHRVAWVLTYGEIEDGANLCHRCDNPPCCNPAHLFLGTCADNNADMCAKGRQAAGDRHGSRKHRERMQRGVARYNAKLNPDSVREIRRLITDGLSDREIAARFGVVSSQVWSVRIGRTWSHVR